jgi:predicted Zn-dependent peptidase
MKRVLFVLFLLASWNGLSGAQEVAYERYRLDNGLQVILHEDHSLPVACVNIWYYVGGKDWIAGRSGLAHMFEHLMFMGTERVPGESFDAIIEQAGGWSNASTSPDRTNYFTFGPRDLLPALLWLEADRMEDLGRTMTEEKLETQKSVVRNERREVLEMEPYGEAEYEISRRVFPPDHPYHLDVIGRHEDLEAATLQDIKDFFDTYYTPNNASMVVAGDFDAAQLKPLIEKLFGSIPRGPEPVRRAAPPFPIDGERRVTFNDDVKFDRVYLVYHSPAYFQPGDAEMDLVAEMLGSGKSSRLYNRLVYEEKLATDVAVFQQSSLLGSLFYVIVTARTGVPLDSIEKVADEEIDRFVAEGPTKTELERYLSTFERGMLSGLQSVARKADRMNLYAFYFDEPNSFRRDLERYREVTLADIRRWAGEVLGVEGRLVEEVVAEEERPLRADRDERPAPLEEKPFAPEEPEVFTLSNGIEVRLWNRSELPLVELSLFLRAGSARMDGAEAGTSALLADMLDEGAGKLGAVAFSDSLEFLGASIRPYARREFTSVRLSALERNLAGALGLFADAVIRPRFDEKEWERVKTLHLEGLRQDEDRPATVAARVGQKAFFGPDHPYGKPMDGTVDDVTAISLDDIKGNYERCFGPEGATIFLAGDVTVEEARKLLEDSLGKWKAGASFENPTAITPRDPANDRARVVVVDKPGAVQTLIRVYMPGPFASDPDRVRYELVNSVLGGGYASRLNQNLREAHGFTYGAGSWLQMTPLAGSLTASSDVQTEVTGAALAEMLKEFERIRTGDIEEDEARMARESLRMETVQRFEGLGGLVYAAEDCALRSVPFSSIGEDLETIGSARLEELNALAPRTVRSDKALFLLLGDKGAIEKQLEGLGLPAPEEWSVEGTRLTAAD